MRRLAVLGASFAGTAWMESIDINVNTPSANRDETFALLKLAMNSPRYDNEPMTRARQNALAFLDQDRLNPGSIASRRLSELLYGHTRYAIPVKGTRAAVSSITVEDLRSYRSQVFARDTVRVAVAGDIDAASLAALLDDLFASLPPRAQLVPPPSVTPAAAQHQSIPMELPQTTVMFANPVPLMDARQAIAADLFNQILSAPFTGRLYKSVREQEGLVYSISTSRGRFTEREVFYGSFGAAPANMAKALALTRSELAKFVAEGPTEQELDDAKGAFRGGFYLGLDTTGKLSAILMTMIERDLPLTYLSDFDALVASITIEDLRAVAKVVARPDLMLSVSVGPPSEADDESNRGPALR